jgi:hypothetical protein
MAEQFKIRFDYSERRFEEELFLRGPNGTEFVSSIMDTGANISIVDLEVADKLGAEIIGKAHVTGVGGTAVFIYRVILEVSATHTLADGRKVEYREKRELGAIPYFWKGGSALVVYIKIPNSVIPVVYPAMILKRELPYISSGEFNALLQNIILEDNSAKITSRFSFEEIRKKVSDMNKDQFLDFLGNLIVIQKKPVIESVHYTGLGSPLLLGVDIMEAMQKKGFPIQFEF